MSLYEWRRGLRGSVAQRDPKAIVAEVSTLLPDECLQMVGSALLIALAANVDGAGSLAARCIHHLRERDWDGDAELVAELEVALGRVAVLSCDRYRLISRRWPTYSARA